MQVELEALLANCEATISRLKDDLRLEERLRGRLLELKGTSPSPQGQADTKNTVVAVSGSLISHITEVLREAGREMKAREIAARVEARGYQTNAKAGLTISVSSALAHNRDELFERVGPGTYKLKGAGSVTQ